MPPDGSDWAALSVELLSEVFTQLSLETKILCEGICKTWRRTLRDEPVQGLWGNVGVLPFRNSTSLPCVQVCTKLYKVVKPPLIRLAVAIMTYKATTLHCCVSSQVSLKNLPCPLAIVETDSIVLISQPPSSQHSAALTGWLVQRHKGMNKVVLGYPKKQSGLENYRQPAFGTHQMLSLMAAKELGQSLQLFIFEMGMFAATSHMTTK